MIPNDPSNPSFPGEGRPEFPESGPLPGDERSPSNPVTMRAALALLIQQGLALALAFGLDLDREQVLAVEAFTGTALLVLAMGFPRLDRVRVAGRTLWHTAAGKVAPVNDNVDPDYPQAA